MKTPFLNYSSSGRRGRGARGGFGRRGRGRGRGRGHGYSLRSTPIIPQQSNKWVRTEAPSQPPQAAAAVAAPAKTNSTTPSDKAEDENTTLTNIPSHAAKSSGANDDVIPKAAAAPATLKRVGPHQNKLVSVQTHAKQGEDVKPKHHYPTHKRKASTTRSKPASKRIKLLLPAADPMNPNRQDVVGDGTKDGEADADDAIDPSSEPHNSNDEVAILSLADVSNEDT